MSCEKFSIVVDNEYNKRKKKYHDELLEKFNHNGNDLEKMIDFPKYSPTESIRQFLIRYELVKIIKDVPGDIIECGVCGGRGLLSLLQSHFILEPSMFYRKLVGFDTFDGFSHLSDIHDNTDVNKPGDFIFTDYNEIMELGKTHTQNFFNDINKIELVKGNAEETIPEYIKQNQHMLISMLYLDFDLYSPTKTALEHLLPRMTKGSIIVFDEIHHKRFPGETVALLESLNINNYKIQNILQSNVNYIIL